jgi:hypothetical protein
MVAMLSACVNGAPRTDGNEIRMDDTIDAFVFGRTLSIIAVNEDAFDERIV